MADGCRSVRSQISPGNRVNTATLPAQPSIQTNVPLAPQLHCADVCHLSMTSLWQSVLWLSNSPVRKPLPGCGCEWRARSQAGWTGISTHVAKGLRAGTGQTQPPSRMAQPLSSQQQLLSNVDSTLSETSLVENNRSAPITPFSPAQDGDSRSIYAA